MKTEKIVYIPSINREKFEKMSRANQRIAICKDVLARLDAKLFIVSPGNFISDGSFGQREININKCEVCGKGAIACAWLGSLNKFNSLFDFDVDANLDHKGTKEIVKVFGRNLWDAIECAFEDESFYWHSDFIESNRLDIIETFHASLFGSENRLREIMNNIIKNKGKMKLSNGKIIGRIK